MFTASLLSYLEPAARSAFASQLDQVARQRRLAWVFAEAPALLASTGIKSPELARPLSPRNSEYVIGASLRDPDGSQHDHLLAGRPLPPQASPDPKLIGRWAAL